MISSSDSIEGSISSASFCPGLFLEDFLNFMRYVMLEPNDMANAE